MSSHPWLAWPRASASRIVRAGSLPGGGGAVVVSVDDGQVEKTGRQLVSRLGVVGGAVKSLGPDGDGLPPSFFADCNGNGIFDHLEIESGFSPDCDENGVPDGCDVDCNDNGTPDSCDVGSGDSPDVDGNGVPDECQRPRRMERNDPKRNAGLPVR